MECVFGEDNGLFLIGTSVNILIDIILILAFGSAFAQEDSRLNVIINKANPVEKMKKSDVADIFLKKKIKWESEELILPVDQETDQAARKDFSKVVLNKTVYATRSYWQSRIFTGRGIPPPELKSDQEVIEYVSKHTHAIGYVTGPVNNSRVKVVDIE